MPSQLHVLDSGIILYQARIGTADILMMWVGQKVLILMNYLDYVSREC